MEIRHLRYFVAVAEHLHFGAAARALHTAQPSLSQQIRRLEAELGVELLERDRHGVSLTAAGYAFLGEARDVIARAERSVAIARDVAGGQSGRIRLACGPGAFGARLSATLRRFTIEHPGVAVEVNILADAASVQALVEERVDVALVYEMPPSEARTQALSNIRFASDELALAVPCGHALASRCPVASSDLRGLRLLLPSAQTYPALHRTVREVYAGLGDDAPVIQQVDDPIALIGLIAAGVGCALVPHDWTRLKPETARIVPLGFWAPSVMLAAYRRTDRRHAALELFEPYLAEDEKVI
jgi:DNA-binding transcriptional LysR family regulator